VGDLGLAAIVGLLLVKEAGLPIPIPGDLLVLGAGIGAASGTLEPASTLALIVAATVVGGTVQFAGLRGGLRRRLLGLLARVGIPETRIEPLASRFRRRGAAGVAVARMTPGVRIVAIPAAAIAAVAPGGFVAGLAIGNAIFIGGHFALGALVGAPAVAIAGSVGPAVVAVVGGLAAVGAVGWFVIGRRRRLLGRGYRRDLEFEAVERSADWTDAACPACLALGALGLSDRGSA
jgi:membrane protein DedA with SNARE-associated domain